MKRVRDTQKRVVEQLEKLRGDMDMSEFCRIHNLSSDAYRAWRLRNSGPDLDLAVRVMKVLGPDGLMDCGIDPWETAILMLPQASDRTGKNADIGKVLRHQLWQVVEEIRRSLVEKERRSA